MANRSLALRNLERRPVNDGFLAERPVQMHVRRADLETQAFMRRRNHGANFLVPAEHRHQMQR